MNVKARIVLKDVESDCILKLFSDESFSTLSSSNSECSFSTI